MGFFSARDKGKSLTVRVRTLASSRPPRQRVSIRVHQARQHWEHHIPLPYPNVTLPHDCHLDPKRIRVPAVPWSARAHAKEVRHRWEQLALEQWRNLVYAVDSPDSEAWIAWEYEEQRRRGVPHVVAGPPPPLLVREEDQEAKAAYENVLTVVRRASEEEACLKKKKKKKEEEEEA
ncbi:hypothetical protein D1007_24068 [Hordeum vulgare]|nr:hypothetical protein D1007_24068 [Hordeum vulgare]